MLANFIYLDDVTHKHNVVKENLAHDFSEKLREKEVRNANSKLEFLRFSEKKAKRASDKVAHNRQRALIWAPVKSCAICTCFDQLVKNFVTPVKLLQ